jgi:hypothetical protein
VVSFSFSSPSALGLSSVVTSRQSGSATGAAGGSAGEVRPWLGLEEREMHGRSGWLCNVCRGSAGKEMAWGMLDAAC